MKTRRGEVLGTESEWGKMSSRLPLPTASPGCIKRLGGGARIRLLSWPQTKNLRPQICQGHDH